MLPFCGGLFFVDFCLADVMLCFDIVFLCLILFFIIMKSFVLSTGMELFVHSRFGTQKFVGALKAAYLYSEQEKKYVCYNDGLKGNVSFHDGDLLVFNQIDGSLTLYRYSSKKCAFTKLSCNVRDFSFSPYVFIYQKGKKSWYCGESETLLGRKKLNENNVFITDIPDGRIMVCYFNKSMLVETVWKNYEIREFLGHRGKFVVGERMDGGFDVLTPAGRLYSPRRHCFLKSNDCLYGWDEASASFLLLNNECDSYSLWMNTVVSSGFSKPFVLFGFDSQNQRVVLASGDSLESIPNKHLRIGDKLFKKTESLMLDF